MLITLFTACESKDEHTLTIDKNAGEIDLSEIVHSDWDEVCLFSPYSNNKIAEDLLGFPWDLEKNSDIYSSDGITLFVFAKNNSVVSYYEVARWADFDDLSGNCFARNNSKFNVKPGGVQHVPKNA